MEQYDPNNEPPKGQPPRGPLASGAISVLWLAWLVLLVGTPFFIEAHHLPSVFSSAYAFIALGMTAGALAAWLLETQLSEKHKTAARKASFVMGLTITFVLVVPEWYFHLRAFAGFALPMEKIAPYAPLMVIFADVPQAPFGNLAMLHHVLLFAAGLCCVLAGATSPKLPAPTDGSSTKKEATDQKKQAGLLAGLFACGLLHPGVWGCLAHTYGSNWSDAVMHDLLGFMGSSIFAIAISIGLALILQRGNRKLGIPASSALAAFALGELAWNLIARCGNAIENVILVAPVASLFLAALEVFLLFLLFRTKSQAETPETPSSQEAPSDQQGTIRIDILFEEKGLTDREKQAVGLALEGLNSNESAEIIGVKASTVRTYLHRAYQKLEIESLDEIRPSSRNEQTQATAPKEAKTGQTASGGANVPAKLAAKTDKQTPRMQRTQSLGTPLFVLLAGLFLLPHQYVGTVSSWNSSHSVVIGCGLGLMMAGGFAYLTHSIAPKEEALTSVKKLCLLLLFLSGSALTFVQYAFAHQMLPLSQSI